MNLIHSYFSKIFLIFLGTPYLKEHLWVAASVYFNREASQGITYFLGKYYFREYLNVEIPHSKLFQGEYYILEGELIY